MAVHESLILFHEWTGIVENVTAHEELAATVERICGRGRSAGEDELAWRAGRGDLGPIDGQVCARMLSEIRERSSAAAHDGRSRSPRAVRRCGFAEASASPAGLSAGSVADAGVPSGATARFSAATRSASGAYAGARRIAARGESSRSRAASATCSTTRCSRSSRAATLRCAGLSRPRASARPVCRLARPGHPEQAGRHGRRTPAVDREAVDVRRRGGRSRRSAAKVVVLGPPGLGREAAELAHERLSARRRA